MRQRNYHDELEELETLWRLQSERWTRERREAEEAMLDAALERYEEGVR